MIFLTLPAELQDEILKYLDGISLAKAECVCKIWKELLSKVIYNFVWRRECFKNIDESVLVEITGIENIIIWQWKTWSHNSAGTSCHIWKTIFKRWYITRKAGKWPVMETEIQAHRGEVSDIQLRGDILYTASSDGSMELWDSWSGVGVKSFSGHFCPVRSIALYPNAVSNDETLPEILLSASEDHKIHIWHVETGHYKGALCGHNNIVNCVVVYKHFVVSASYDETIKIWNLKTDLKSACLNTLKGHCSPVTFLSVWKMKALSVSYKAIMFWSLENGECLYIVKDIDHIRTSVTQGCVLRDSQALVVKSNGELKFCYFGHPSSEVFCYRLLDYSTTQGSRVSCLTTYGNLMAIGTDAGVVYLFHYKKDWSEELSELHCTVQTGHGSLCCVRLSCNEEGPILMAGYSDGLVKLFRWFSPSVD